MTRTVIALVLGALIGVGITLWLAPSSFTQRQVGAWLPAEPIALPSTNAVAPPAVREASRDFYSRLAAADAAELAAMIQQAVAGAPSPDRDLALAVLFKRYAELDPVRAVRFVRETRVGGAALGAVYGSWARAAPEQVVAALSTVTRPSDAAQVALALIAALGDDAAAVRRVGAILAARGEDVPQPIGPSVGPGVATASALALTAQRWADLDARRALAVAGELDDERVRLAFETAALRTLARIAPDEAFAHLKTLDLSAPQPGTLAALAELSRVDPERLLDAVADWPPESRRALETTAMQQLAQRDPLAAARRLERWPPGPERQMLLQSVARAYGKLDATAALAWARDQRGEQNLLGAVVAGVGESDPDRALDLALGLNLPMERMRAVQMVAMAAARNDATAEALANRLLTVDDPQIRDQMASMVTMRWSSRAPERAAQWLLAHAEVATPSSFVQIGQQLASREPQRATAYTSQVPATAREAWVHGVAQGYAQNDPQGAIGWLGQFRGEEWYGRAAGTVAMAVAERDGAAAARLFDEVGAEPGGMPPTGLVGAIATGWANQDPAAAANWSADRPNDEVRDMAVRSVVAVWSTRDPDAARQWTLRLPQGAVRDTALTAVLTTSAMQTSGDLDSTVLSAFASPPTQQSAVLQVVQQMAYRDPAKARAITATHLDANFRAQAETMIEAARNGQPPRLIGGRPMNVVTPAQRVAPALPTRQP
jgi:hypothetical protein